VSEELSGGQLGFWLLRATPFFIAKVPDFGAGEVREVRENVGIRVTQCFISAWILGIMVGFWNEAEVSGFRCRVSRVLRGYA
jgi:hypothetical protein